MGFFQGRAASERGRESVSIFLSLKPPRLKKLARDETIAADRPCDLAFFGPAPHHVELSAETAFWHWQFDCERIIVLPASTDAAVIAGQLDQTFCGRDDEGVAV
jgi:hypothetical protein